MKIRITKTIKWYEFENRGITYDVREVRVTNINGIAVKDITIFHGNKPVMDKKLNDLFIVSRMIQEETL